MILPSSRSTGRRSPAARAVVPPMLLAAALVLSGCGDDAGPGSESAAGQEAAEAPAGSEQLLSAAEAGRQRAASFGFDAASYATESAVEEFRAQADQTLAGDAAEAVEPASCAEPLAAVDWAPLLLDADVARVDFGSGSFTGTGSVEIAEAADEASRDRVAEHLAHVRQLLGSCTQVSYEQAGGQYTLEFADVDAEVVPEESEAPEQTSAYTWRREFADGGSAGDSTEDAEAESSRQTGTTVAQILLSRRGEDVVMVSFIGEPAAGSAEFTAMAEAVAAETLDGLAD